MNRVTMFDRLQEQGWTSPRTPSEFSTRNGTQASNTAPLQDVNPWSGGFTKEDSRPLASPGRVRNLLVPLDGGPFGEHAIPYALAIARRAGATVRLVHVHSRKAVSPSDATHSVPGLQPWPGRHRPTYLEDLVRRLARVSSVPMKPVLLEGRDVADSLRAEACDGIDLIVMTNPGRSRLAPFCHGSITSTLMQRLPIPQLYVRSQNTPPELSVEPTMGNVLIPLDGTQDGERAAKPALALGSLWDAHHTLLRVIRWKFDYSLGYGGTSFRPLMDVQRKEAWDYLRHMSDRLQPYSQRIRSRTLFTDESVAEAILWYAQKQSADLIAMTTRTRGWFAQLWRGSVTNRVIQGATAPVLVLPSTQAKGQG